MAESTAQLLTRITVLLEQLLAEEKEEAQRFEAIAKMSVTLDQHGESLASAISRLEEMSKQRLADQAELRSLLETLRTNVRHDTANAVTPFIRAQQELREKTQDLREKTAEIVRVRERDEEGDVDVRVNLHGSIPLKTIVAAGGAALTAISGWLWHYHKEIAKLFGG